MGTRTPSSPSVRLIALYGIVSVWGLILVIDGVLSFSEPWGLMTLCAGGLIALATIAGLWQGQPMISLFTALLASAGALIGAGAAADDEVVAASGGLAIVIVGVAAAIVWQLADLRASMGGDETIREDTVERLLTQIHANSILSDNAKRVLFRDRELELLRNAIEEDIRQGDYNAAITLCDEMANLFGQREEAENFRAHIMQARREDYEAQVHAAITHFDELLHARDWGSVHQEAARLRRLYADSHLVQDLDERIHAAREAYKREVAAEFHAAAGRADWDTAMALLRDLDKYLSREEGESLSDTAQQVVARFRESLGDRFKIAVNQRDWASAAHIGDTIIAEYPNSKMADEVRSMIDLIRTRATEAAIGTEA